MTVQGRNEAAERLLRELGISDRWSLLRVVDEALAAERRATVERIRQRVNGLEVAEAHFGTIVGTFNNIRHILDEEAAR